MPLVPHLGRRRLLTASVGAAALAALPRPVLAEPEARPGPEGLVGSPAPALRLRPLEGESEITLASLSGQIVLLAFVATWCGACRRLEPQLAELSRRHAESGLRTLLLSHEDRARLRAHVSTHAPELPWVQCTGRTAIAYRATALPTAAVLDRRGVVRAATQGAGADVLATLEAGVRAALVG